MDISPVVEHTALLYWLSTGWGRLQRSDSSEERLYGSRGLPSQTLLSGIWKQARFLPNLSIIDLLFNMGPESVWFCNL